MFIKLLKFEWNYHFRKLLFWFTALAFSFFGFVLTVGGIKLPNININSPYMINYNIGLMSMGIIFVVSIFCANAILRDNEYNFGELVYATAVKKINLLGSLFLGTLLSATIAFFFVAIGMILGISMPWVSADFIGDFNISFYLWPLLVFSLPNVLLCSSLVFFIGSISKNRVAIYVAGLSIYILYIVASIFSNAPWMANPSPASADAISLAALVDPFGLSAFFEQTKFWTFEQKNTTLISLTGNLLWNRIIWITFSFLMLFLVYKIYSFRKINRKAKKLEKEENDVKTDSEYFVLDTEVMSFKSQWNAFISLTKVEISTIYKGLPFLIIMLAFVFLLGMETIAMVEGGRRLPDNYPLTANFISNILEMVPLYGVIMILFYSNEQLWKNRVIKIDSIIDATAIKNFTLFTAKYAGLIFIPFLLISVSIMLSVFTQIYYGYYDFEFSKYLSLYYYIGLPLILIAVLALFIQNLVNNKYVGLIISFIVILIISSKLRLFVGLEHILFQYAPNIYREYSDMNGFGNYVSAFVWQNFYSTCLAGIFLLLTIGLWNRGAFLNIRFKLSIIGSQWGKTGKLFLLLSFILFLGSGSYIFYQTNVLNDFKNLDEARDWAQMYEEKYKQFYDMNLPSITDVKAHIDLYPSKQKYIVKGNYVLKNKSDEVLLNTLIGLDKQVKLLNLTVNNGSVTSRDEEYGHFWVTFDEPLKQGEEITMQFEIEVSWSPFLGHEKFNAIVSNGSFIRMSRYFPFFGYEPDFELKNQDNRKKRGLPKRAENIKRLDEVLEDSYERNSYDYDFINFEAVVSTAKDQIAVGPGNLIKEWKEGNRNYFHYMVDRPIPFRFAFASAKYNIKRESYKGVDLEVYYHPKHHFNIDEMISSMKQTLDYCTSQFGPYQYNYIRNVEVSEFTGGFAATAYPGTIFTIENRGFQSDLRDKSQPQVINQLMGHEMSHQWWGGQLDPENREGSLVLTEGLAQYTELMIYEKTHGKKLALEMLNLETDDYLRSRGFREEKPLYKTYHKQHYVHYSKGIKVLNAIRDLIGEENLNKALKYLINHYAYPQKPANIYDFIEAIKENSPIKHHQLIEDWMKKIIIYDLKIKSAKAKVIENGKYELNLKLESNRREEDGKGNASSSSLNEEFLIKVYGYEEVIYSQKHHFNKKETVLNLILDHKPRKVAIDPEFIAIDINREDNFKEVSMMK